MSKILIGTGYSQYESLSNIWKISTSFEVLDLTSEASVCPDVESFPVTVADGASGLSFANEIVACGGTDDQNVLQNGCFKFASDLWTDSPLKMNQKRCCGSSFFSPENYGPGRIFYVGGYNDQVVCYLQCQLEILKNLCFKYQQVFRIIL